MNVISAGSNLASTSIFEENMSDLTTSLDPASASQLSGTRSKIIKNTTSTGKSSKSQGSSIGSTSSSSTLSSSWSLFLSNSFISSSPSSSSSSSSSSENPSSSTWNSPSTSYEEEATLEADARSLQRLTLPSSALEASLSTSSSESWSESGVFGINSGVIGATRASQGNVVNRDKELVGSVALSSSASSSTTSSSNAISVGVLDGEETREEADEEATDNDKTLVNHYWTEDEGFASGDESGDDSEPDDDNNPRANSSISLDIEGETAGSGSSDNSRDTRLLDTIVDGDTELLFGFVDTMEDLESMSFNGSFYNENSSEYWNDSMCNDSYIVHGMYPSGYSMFQIILASIAASILMIVVVVGNMLVIIAIATEKALKNIGNWFIASLAVADFFLGLVIMPFSLANEIMGYWIFGYWWCDIYSAMDVLLCTASIMNLCLISLDRYWSITQAIKYLKKRTPARVALMITLVWLLSALVCIPPLLGWKRPAPAEEYPKCSLSEDIGYVLYSALGSFYIPSCIMVFVYIRIYFAAKARARRGIRKLPRPRPAVPPESPDIRQTSFTQSTPATEGRRMPGPMDNVATIENQPVQIPIVTCDFASDVSTSEAEPGGGSFGLEENKDTLKVSMPIPMPKGILKKTSLTASPSMNGSGESASSQCSIPARCRAPSVGIDVDMVSEFDPSSSDSGVVSRCAVVKPLKLRLCRPIFGRKAIGKLKREHADPGKHAGREIQEEAKPPKPRDPEREKRRLAKKKEKRATLIVGLIMGSFIACWLPFFFLYIVKPIFPSLNIPGTAFVVAFWLGYINSALNPVIYTVFNKDFRRAFRRILYK